MSYSKDPLAVKQLGLTLLHPRAADALDFDSTANIVFIHGLRGHPTKTWSYREEQMSRPDLDVSGPKKQPKGHFISKVKAAISNLPLDKHIRSGSAKATDDMTTQKLCWPADLLPNSVHTAKIWTYGYNAEVVSGLFQANNKNSVLQHGNDFMVKLTRELQDEKPIILVAHSLGGLVVKVALTRMHQSLDKTRSECFRRVKAIVFCGTPHRGSNVATWGQLATNLVSMALTDSNTKLLKDLQVNSEILGLIQYDFLNVLHHCPIRIHSFKEGRPSSGVKGFNGLIVDDNSSTCGYQLETVETIDADHRQMVKMPAAKVICDVLHDIHRCCVNKTKETNTNTKGQTRGRYTYLDRFFTVDYEAIFISVPERHPNTCTWLLETEATQNWLSKTGLAILWLHGYPGVGKSVLARYLVETLRRRHLSPHNRDSAALVFFFCSYRDIETSTMKSLVSSLIHQFISADEQLGNDVVAKRFKVIDRKITGSMKKLWTILLDLINAMEQKTVYIVIDALDELDRTSWITFLRTFLDLLAETTTKQVKLAITSRTEVQIEKLLAPISTQLDLDKTGKGVSDISAYLSDTVREYGRENCFGEEMCESILSELNKRADGMFLWANLAWAYYIDGVGLWTTKLVQEKLRDLQRLPPGMDMLYYRILSAVDKRATAELLHCFGWIVVATRPLTIDELSIAMALRDKPCCVSGIDVRLNLRNFFRQSCPHLVKVDHKGLITLVHQSFKEFLLQTTKIMDVERPIPNTFFIDYDHSRYESGLDCLVYLGLEDFHVDDSIWRQWAGGMVIDKPAFEKYIFLKYCVLNWAIHLINLDDAAEVWEHYAKTLQGNTHYMRWEPNNPSIFYLLKAGLKGLLKRGIKFGFNINELSSTGEHIIHTAAGKTIHMAFDDINFLLELGADINGRDKFGQTLLHRLIRNELPAGVEQWLAKAGVNINAQDLEGQTALHAAVRTIESTEAIISSLTAARGIDVNIVDTNGRSPLCLASHWGREVATKRLLLIADIDVGRATPQGEHPLINAVIQTWTNVADLMLDKLDAVGDYRDARGRNILHLTIHNNMPKVLRKALTKEEQCLEAADSQGWRPLHCAADDGNVEVVEILLNQGASTSSLTNFMETALHLAATKGHFGVVKVLARSMPEFAINTQDHNGWTALHRALNSGRNDMATWLLEQDGVSLTPRDKHGRSAIFFAAAFATPEVLNEFNARRPEDVRSVDSFGYNLLHMAASSANRPNVEFLFDIVKLSPEAENCWGKRPLDLSPTEKFSQYLRIRGFEHSRRYREQLRKLKMQRIYESRVSSVSHPEWIMTTPYGREGDGDGKERKVTDGKRASAKFKESDTE